MVSSATASMQSTFTLHDSSRAVPSNNSAPDKKFSSDTALHTIACDLHSSRGAYGSETVVYQGTSSLEACSSAISEYFAPYVPLTVEISQYWASSNINHFPQFISPGSQSQECDIYGPLCQTGSMTASMSVASEISTTVVPCSYYASAQSFWANPLGTNGVDVEHEYWTAFGRSPDCWSYADYLDSASRQDTPPLFSKCDNSSGTLKPWQQYIPPAASTDSGWQPCCGNCMLNVEAGRVLFFPDQNLKCRENLGNRTSINSLPLASTNHFSTTVLSGYTL